MRFTINFYDKHGEQTDSCVFYVSPSNEENLFDRVEETLYITQELTPVKPLAWREELFDNNCMTYFTYHNVERVRVSFDPSENTFACEDVG